MIFRFISTIYLVVFLMDFSTNVSALDLPPEAQRDMYVVSLANHLKAEEWKKAYPFFKKIEVINKKNKLKPDPTVIFYHGEVSFHLKKYEESEKYLASYIRKAGSNGAFYRKALQLLTDLEPKMAKFYQRKSFNLWLKNKNDKKALQLWLKAVELGYKGEITLGRSYETGGKSRVMPTFIVKKDYAEAASWYQKAVDRGDPAGIISLARMYLKGLGVSKDAQQAIRLLKRASKRGYLGESAFYELGLIYAKGDGVEKDREKAIYWYKKLADRGGLQYSKNFKVENAQLFLSELYLNSPVDSQDLDQGKKYLQLAAHEKTILNFSGDKTSASSVGGHPDARNELMLLYYRGGKGFEKDESKAFKLAAFRPLYPSQFLILGEMYFEGSITQQNYKKAKKYLTKVLKHKRSSKQQKQEAQKILDIINGKS